MEKHEKPFVSVLTPVYNCEKYLRECIQSVLAQTYQNWEYIIVNNCSTDQTLSVAQEFVAKDRRITVHNNVQFVRVIKNHNTAFSLMSPQSKYCKVVHADDWIFPECLEKMVELAEANPSVGLVCSYGLFGNKVQWDGLPPKTTVFSGREICRKLFLEGLYVFGSPTTTLIRSDIIRNRTPFWDESSIHADSEANIELLRDHDFGFVHQVLSFIMKREGVSSLAEKLNSYLSSHLRYLTKYGPFYLSDDELRTQLRWHLRNYYRYLAKSFLQRKGREFWRYHKTELRELGYPISVRRLVWTVSLLLFDKILNPKQTAEGLIHSLNFSISKNMQKDS